MIRKILDCMICLVKQGKNHFQILSDLRIQSWSFLKEGNLSCYFIMEFASVIVLLWLTPRRWLNMNLNLRNTPLTHHDPKDLGLHDLFSKARQKPCLDSFRFKNPILDFLKGRHPQLSFYHGICLSNNIALATTP